MSVEAMHGGHGHGHAEIDDPHLAHHHQFEERAQQDECYLVGMWSFLVTEIMFFGALFIAYMVYRTQMPAEFAELSRENLDVKLGFINTLILLTSSFFMALAVQKAQMKNTRWMRIYLLAVIACAFGFLGIKYIEYSHKFHEHHVPGPSFQYKGEHASSGKRVEPEEHTSDVVQPVASGPKVIEVDTTGTKLADKAQLFFSIYFIMTGLHGIHVIIGILIMAILFIMSEIDHPNLRDFMPVEMAGLYWHFVDIVWIFLYPLLYLIHPDLSNMLKF